MFWNGLAQVMHSARHCNFAGTDCWTVRVHPKIKKVSANSGYTTGGQRLRIEGVSLNGTNVAVNIDGQVCQITNRSLDFIDCVTSSKNSASNQGYQPGQPGMLHW
jgi:hypothetical protein